MSDRAEKSKSAVATQTAHAPRPILPAPAATSSETAIRNGKPVAVRVENESPSLTINQQLASHLASASGVKLPVAKRKRGSLDSHLTGFKVKQPVELRRIGFIGAGNIARALAEGWIAGGGCGLKYGRPAGSKQHAFYIGQVNYACMTATVRSLSSPNLKLMKVMHVLHVPPIQCNSHIQTVVFAQRHVDNTDRQTSCSLDGGQDSWSFCSGGGYARCGWPSKPRPSRPLKNIMTTYWMIVSLFAFMLLPISP